MFIIKMEGRYMLYRKFGKTCEMLSMLGFGCMRLPLVPGGTAAQIDEDQAIRMIRHAIDAGVNYIDTAYPYHGTGMESPGQSEPLVAKALQDGYRDKVKIATKLPIWLVKSRADMDRYLGEQMERLKTDYIDFYLAHSLNSHEWPKMKDNDICGFMNAAIADGRIKYAGFSFHDKLGLFKEIVDFYDWSFCQIQYNYLDEEYQAGTEGMEYAAGKGMGVAIMEPLRGGSLVNNLPREAIDIFAGNKVKRTPAEWALRWVWSHPEAGVVLSGMSSMEQLVDNLRAVEESGSIDPAELKMIGQVKNIFKDRMKVNCTSCGYCMPCPHGVNIPSCFSAYNNSSMFGVVDEDYHEWMSPRQKASNCKECGECETHCPQGILIREELKNVKDFFEPNK